ncbi:MAG: ribonuclease P protein component [Chlamydiota bacterium]
MRFTFPKTLRLRKREEYLRLGEKKNVYRSKWVSISYKKENLTKMGLTISSKFGSSVERNRCKRLLKEVFRNSQHKIPYPIHCNVYPFKCAKEATLTDLQNDFLAFLQTLCN